MGEKNISNSKPSVFWIWDWDLVLVVISFLGLSLSAIPLLSDKLFQRLFAQEKVKSLTPGIGILTYVANDIRYKNPDSFSWSKPVQNEEVHLGDSVFSGAQSATQIQLNSSDTIALGENSLITFKELNNLNIPNLEYGNFLVKLSGKTKVMINGEATEVESDKADIQFDLKKNEVPKVILRAGKAKLKTSNQEEFNLTPMEVKPVVLSKKKTLELPNENLRTPTAIQPEPLKINLDPIGDPLVYQLQVDDLFQVQNNKITPVINPKDKYEVKTKVSWSTSQKNDLEVFVQLSKTEDFQNLVDSFKVKDANSGFFQKAVPGKNYFRISADGKIWSPVNSFKLIVKNLELQPPRLVFNPSTNLLVGKKPISIHIQPSGSPQLTRFIIQELKEINGSTEVLKTNFIDRKGMTIKVADPRQIIFRIYGVNSLNQITQASENQVLSIKAEKTVLAQKDAAQLSGEKNDPKKEISPDTIKKPNIKKRSLYRISVDNIN